MSNRGVVFFDNQNPDDRKLIYDTRNQRLKVHINEGTNRLRSFVGNGGTGLVSNGVEVYETLYEIQHNLKFRPKVLFYIYCLDAPPDYVSRIGGYSGDAFLFLEQPSIFFYSVVYYEVDETYFRIVHSYFAPDATPSIADNWQFRFKYMITDTVGHVSTGRNEGA